MTDPAPLPDIPTDLGPSGGRLWQEITEDYELRPDELTVLHSACRLRDTVDTLTDALAGAPLMVRGSMGQDVLHPAYAERRQTETAISNLLSKLKFCDPGDVEVTTLVRAGGKMTRSEAGRKAAATRWDNRGAS